MDHQDSLHKTSKHPWARVPAHAAVLGTAVKGAAHHRPAFRLGWTGGICQGRWSGWSGLLVGLVELTQDCLPHAQIFGIGPDERRFDIRQEGRQAGLIKVLASRNGSRRPISHAGTRMWLLTSSVPLQENYILKSKGIISAATKRYRRRARPSVSDPFAIIEPMR